MDFGSFTQHIKQAYSKGLPGETAQYSMAPFNRPFKEVALKTNPTPKESAVLVCAYEKENQAHIVLTQRPTYNGAHSGQISFPGGKKELSDNSLLQTALREANEEIGLQQLHLDVVGELTSLYIPPSGFLVYPYLALSNHQQTFKRDEREVESIIELPVAELLDAKNLGSFKFPVGSSKLMIEAPCFLFFGHKVWGATAMILAELKALLTE